MFAFDTSSVESDLIGGQTDVNVIYIDESGINLSSPLPNPFLTSTQTITVRVINSISQDIDGACFDDEHFNAVRSFGRTAANQFTPNVCKADYN